MPYESLNEALIECVRACGGSKQVGPQLWPEKAPEAAQRMLLDCLNEDRPAHLTPDHVMLILKMARARGFHGVITFALDSLGYAPTVPIEPRDEVAELQRQFIEASAAIAEQMGRAERMAARIASLTPQLRAVA